MRSYFEEKYIFPILIFLAYLLFFFMAYRIYIEVKEIKTANVVEDKQYCEGSKQ